MALFERDVLRYEERSCATVVANKKVGNVLRHFDDGALSQLMLKNISRLPDCNVSKDEVPEILVTKMKQVK